MIAIQWSRQEGYPAQSVDDRLLCVLCPNWCGVFGTWGSPSDDSPLFFQLSDAAAARTYTSV